MTKRTLSILLLAISFLASGLVAVLLGQDSSWDLRNYHYYNAYSFLNNRLAYDIAPAQIQSYLNPLLDVPFYLLMTSVAPVVAGFIIGAVHGINIWLVYKICYSVLDGMPENKRRFVSIVAGLAGYTGAANFSEVGTVFNDNVISLFILGALLIIISSIQHHKARGAPLFISGLLLGVSAGLKLTGVLYAIAILGAMPLVNASWKSNIRNVLKVMGGQLVGFSASAGYWMWMLWKQFESPLFPFFNSFFQSPYYDLVNFSDARFFPQGIAQTLLYPFYFFGLPQLVGELYFRDARIPIVYALLIVFIARAVYSWMTSSRAELRARRGDPRSCSRFWIASSSPDGHRGPPRNDENIIIAFFVFSYILWLYQFSMYRFAIPLELLSPVVIIILLWRMPPRNSAAFSVAVAILFIVVATTSPLRWGRTMWSRSVVDVSIPFVEDLEGAVVIIADGQPLSYIIPFFPNRTRFVSINNNFLRPDSSFRFREDIQAVIEKNNAFYLLHKGENSEEYDAPLASYHLGISGQERISLSSNFDSDLFLTKLTKQ